MKINHFEPNLNLWVKKIYISSQRYFWVDDFPFRFWWDLDSFCRGFCSWIVLVRIRMGCQGHLSLPWVVSGSHQLWAGGETQFWSETTTITTTTTNTHWHDTATICILSNKCNKYNKLISTNIIEQHSRNLFFKKLHCNGATSCLWGYVAVPKRPAA